MSRKTSIGAVAHARFFTLVDNKYRVTVYTGNERGGGTDADVFITLFGPLGESGSIMLDDKKNNFEKGK